MNVTRVINVIVRGRCVVEKKLETPVLQLGNTQLDEVTLQRLKALLPPQ